MYPCQKGNAFECVASLGARPRSSVSWLLWAPHWPVSNLELELWIQLFSTGAHIHAHAFGTRTYTHYTIQVNGSLQQVTTFDDLDDEVMIQIARLVPLGCTNLSQLNHRAKELQLSDYQPMFDWIHLMKSTDIERWVDVFCYRLLARCTLAFCLAIVCALFGMYCLRIPTNAVCCIYSRVQVFWQGSVGSDAVSTP